jgi:uncharacterized coiled-coil DUF342 family protein
MRTRLVFWGTNEKNEKVLIGLKLNEEENNIDVYVFPEANTTEDFVTQMHQNWRLGEDILFPEDVVTFQRTLNISESILPEGYAVDREDILKRAQTEWHFVVLSAKLFHSYESEIEDFKEKIKNLSKFDSEIWDDLKRFWSKVQEQVREKNLFRDHANSIRDHTNHLFSELKELRKELDQEFREVSTKNMQVFQEKLEKISNKIEEGLSLQPIFQELKELQRNFKNTRFSSDHRSQVWKKLDGLFKKVKEKKFGEGTIQKSNPLERINRRFNGLINAIQKMERSIERDHKDLEFQNKRIEHADGSLEAQIRAAKIKMIEERIRSKHEKLGEMEKTRDLLEGKISVLKKKEEVRKEREEVERAKQKIKDKIAQEIKEAERARASDESVQRAAQTIQEEEGTSVIEKIEDGIEDVIDTIKAIAGVIEEKFESVMDRNTEEEE